VTFTVANNAHKEDYFQTSLSPTSLINVWYYCSTLTTSIILETEKQLGKKWSGKEIILRRFRKTVSVGAEATSGGRLFQRRLPATTLNHDFYQ